MERMITKSWSGHDWVKNFFVCWHHQSLTQECFKDLSKRSTHWLGRLCSLYSSALCTSNVAKRIDLIKYKAWQDKWTNIFFFIYVQGKWRRHNKRTAKIYMHPNRMERRSKFFWLPDSTYLYLDFHLCSTTKLKEHSRVCHSIGNLCFSGGKVARIIGFQTYNVSKAGIAWRTQMCK